MNPAPLATGPSAANATLKKMASVGRKFAQPGTSTCTISPISAWNVLRRLGRGFAIRIRGPDERQVRSQQRHRFARTIGSVVMTDSPLSSALACPARNSGRLGGRRRHRATPLRRSP
jgi:hypothetical protein